MARILYLVHRVPFPPNKGDKVRSFNLLKVLAERHEVYLGAFVDTAEDARHGETLGRWCQEVFLRRLRPAVRTAASLRGLLTGAPLTLPYYSDAAMRRWVAHKLRSGSVDGVVAFSSAMAQYASGPRAEGLRRIIDMVDVDSEKWRAYADQRPWPWKWIYAREARRLLALERRVAAEFDAAVFVSPEEAALFRRLAPEVDESGIVGIRNGVDTEYFSPAQGFADPFGAHKPALVFTGAMDYWANIDAVVWFAERVFPLVRSQVPQAHFHIVGARPSGRVHRLGRIPGVHVTGAVPDVRPYLAHARLAVAPLRIARGIQNKVLEAMAMGRPVVATRAAMDGIDVPDDLGRLVADRPQDMAARCIEVLRGGAAAELGAQGREVMVRDYDWRRTLGPFLDLVEPGPLAARLKIPGADAVGVGG